MKNFDIANIYYESLTCAQREPHSADDWLRLGWSAPGAHQALACFEQARRLQPHDPLALFSLSWARSQAAQNDSPLDPLQVPPELAQALLEDDPEALQAAIRGLAHAEARAQPLGPGAPQRRFGLWALLYLAGIAAAELLTTLLHTTAIGLILHGLLLAGLLLHSAFPRAPRQRQALLALAFAPLIRLVSLSVPLHDLPLVYWYALVGAPLFLALFVGMRAVRISRRQAGLTLRGWPQQALFGLTGLALGYLEYLILRPQPLAAGLSWEALWLPALILLVFTGLLEELIFRGFMQRAFNAALGRWAGLVFVSLVFAALHIGYRSLLDVLFVFAVAFLFGLLVQRSGSILGVTLAHGLTNITLFLVFPFLAGAGLLPTTLEAWRAPPPWVQAVPHRADYQTPLESGPLEPAEDLSGIVPVPTITRTPTESLSSSAPTDKLPRQPTPQPTLTPSALSPALIPTLEYRAPDSGFAPQAQDPPKAEIRIDDDDSGFSRQGGEG